MYYKIINRRKLMLTRLADAIGKVLSLPFRFGRRMEIRPSSVRSILVVRTAYIGDLLLALPILKPLKQGFPDAKITVLTSLEASPVLERNPFVDEVITFNPFWFYGSGVGEYLRFLKSIRKRSFDLLIETRADIREILLIAAPIRSKHRVSYAVGGGAYLLTHVVPYAGTTHRVDYHLNIASYLGCPPGPVEWGFYLADSERDEARSILEACNVSRPFIAVHPGSRLPLKMWPTPYYAALFDHLIEKYRLPLVVLGGRGDEGIVREITGLMKNPVCSLAGRLGIRQMAAILEEAMLFICNDSAPTHVAASMRTPTAAIFGPSKSIETGPYCERCIAIEKDFACRYSCDENTCLNAVRQECMQTLKPSEVLTAVDSLIAGISGGLDRSCCVESTALQGCPDVEKGRISVHQARV